MCAAALLAWIFGVSSFNRFLTQLADTVKNCLFRLLQEAGHSIRDQSCSHERRKVIYKQKAATNACIWMQGFAAVHVFVSKFEHKPLESIQKKTPACCSTTQITHRLILLSQRQDIRYQDVSYDFEKMGLSKIVLETYLERVMTLRGCALKRLKKEYVTQNGHISQRSNFPLLHTQHLHNRQMFIRNWSSLNQLIVPRK